MQFSEYEHQRLAALLPDYQTKLNTNRRPINQALLAQQYGDMAAEMLEELLPMLLMEAAPMHQELLASSAAEDAEGVWQAAHMLRGAAVSIGAHVLSDLCDVIEIAGKSGDLALTKAPIQNVSIELDRLAAL